MKKREEQTRKVIDLDVEKILEPLYLVRFGVEESEKIKELANSIDRHGLLEPIVVMPHLGRYVIIAGHRRFLAHKMLGKKKISCLVLNVTVEQSILMRWEENEIREDVSDYEKAIFLRELIQKTKLSQKELASRIGKSEAYVSQNLKVLNSFPCVVDAFKNNRITFSIARELANCPSENIAKELIIYCKDGNANAAQVRRWVQDAITQINSDLAQESPEEYTKEIIKYDDQFVCEACLEQRERNEMTLIRVCRKCAKIITNPDL